MTTDRPVPDYTRVSDDASILCRRRDFPRAVNVLQRRDPDRRRWRLAFHTVMTTGGQMLDGGRRAWFEGALREVVGYVPDARLRGELVLDARASESSLDLGGILPTWTARQLWRMADDTDLPMEYIVSVTTLPPSINAPIDTARVILDCRRTAVAHRALAGELNATLSPLAAVFEASGRLDDSARRTLAEVRAQADAAKRWRTLAERLLQNTD